METKIIISVFERVFPNVTLENIVTVLQQQQTRRTAIEAANFLLLLV